jgi:hypothetical protein
MPLGYEVGLQMLWLLGTRMPSQQGASSRFFCLLFEYFRLREDRSNCSNNDITKTANQVMIGCPLSLTTKASAALFLSAHGIYIKRQGICIGKSVQWSFGYKFRSSTFGHGTGVS